jgi:coenzyme PQQ precursor peptide PqqA
MTEWSKPEFVEVRMDAEINCYSSAWDDMAAAKAPRKPQAGARSLPDREDPAAA